MIYTDQNVNVGENHLVFSCPCEKRAVLIREENGHSWKFTDGKLTINGSILNQDINRKCHFFIKDGEPEFCDDSTCPGAKL